MVVILCQHSSAKSMCLRGLPFGPFCPQSFMLAEENPDSWLRELGCVAFEILAMVGMVSNYSELSVQSPRCSI